MASYTLASKPGGTASRRSREASVSLAASSRARENEIESDHSISVKFRRLRGNGAVRAYNDPIDPLLRLVQLSLTMLFKVCPALVREDRFIELDLPAFEAPHDLLELSERVLEAHRSDVGR